MPSENTIKEYNPGMKLNNRKINLPDCIDSLIYGRMLICNHSFICISVLFAFIDVNLIKQHVKGMCTC